jgi:hypothetical protein
VVVALIVISGLLFLSSPHEIKRNKNKIGYFIPLSIAKPQKQLNQPPPERPQYFNDTDTRLDALLLLHLLLFVPTASAFYSNFSFSSPNTKFECSEDDNLCNVNMHAYLLFPFQQLLFCSE